MVQIEGTIQQKEFIRFQFLDRQVQLVFIWIFIVLMIWFIVNFGDPYATAAMAFGFFVLYTALVTAAFLFSTWQRSRMAYRSNPMLQHEHQWTLDSEGITQTLAQGEEHFSWQEVVVAHQYRNLYVIYVSKRRAIVLPHRLFASREEQQRLEQLLHTQLQASQKGKHLV